MAGNRSQSTPVALADLASTPCLVLLGEAGIGKSTEMKSLLDRPADIEWPRGFLDLGEGGYDTCDSLERAICGVDGFGPWQSGASNFELILDSLDEALIPVPQAWPRIMRVLKQAGADAFSRLRLRIACRPGSWLSSYARDLEGAFQPSAEEGERNSGGEGVRVLRLAPLRRRDAEHAANDHGVDGGAFVRDVEEMALQPLAANPQTLLLLVQSAEDGQPLPPTRSEAYQRGLRALLHPTDERQRRGLEEHNEVTLMPVCEWLAAASIFGGRPRFTRYSGAPGGSAELLLTDVCGAYGQTSCRSAPSEGLIAAAWRTGVFTASGSGLVFAHKSFAEYLAARWISANLSPQQQRSLIVVDTAGAARVPPQLRDTAAWLAQGSPAMFDVLLDVEPEAIFLGDVRSLTATQRASLCRKVLTIAEWDPARRSLGYTLGDHAAALRCPEVDDLLHATVRSASPASEAKYFALRACSRGAAPGLTEECVSIALDFDAPNKLRCEAVRYLHAIGAASDLERLRPLLLSALGEDPDRDLRGVLLRALWPAHLIAGELGRALVADGGRYFGAYDTFLYSDIDLSMFSGEQLAALLVNIREVEPRAQEHGALRRFLDHVLRHAYEHADAPRGARAVGRNRHGAHPEAPGPHPRPRHNP